MLAFLGESYMGHFKFNKEEPLWTACWIELMTWGMGLVPWATWMSSNASWKKYRIKVKCYQDLWIEVILWVLLSGADSRALKRALNPFYWEGVSGQTIRTKKCLSILEMADSARMGSRGSTSQEPAVLTGCGLSNNVWACESELKQRWP